MKKFLAWALIALPVLAACENEDELKDDNVSGTSVEVSMKNGMSMSPTVVVRELRLLLSRRTAHSFWRLRTHIWIRAFKL